MDAGGLQQLLTLQSNKHTYAGFSYALFGLASIPVAFERVVCRLESVVTTGYVFVTICISAQPKTFLLCQAVPMSSLGYAFIDEPKTRKIVSEALLDMAMQCALPSHVMDELVGRALSLLTCGYDPARKNVALFFGAAIHFRAVLAVFDRCQGLRRLLDSLRTVLRLLRASASESRTEKQVLCSPSSDLNAG